MRRSLEQLQPHLEEFSLILRAWHKNRDSDSVRIQNLRRSELSVAERMAEELVYGPQRSHQLVLTVGTEPIDVHRFNKGAYDFYSKYTYQAKPGMDIAIDRTESMFERGRRNLYLGGFVLVHITDIAQTLVEDGALQIRPVEEVPRLDLAELRD